MEIMTPGNGTPPSPVVTLPEIAAHKTRAKSMFETVAASPATGTAVAWVTSGQFATQSMPR